MDLVVLFGFLVSVTEVLFEVFDIEFTAETSSLLAATIFLLIRSTSDLIRFFIGQDDDEPATEQAQEKSFSRLLLEMSLVNAVLSVDTVIAPPATPSAAVRNGIHNCIAQDRPLRFQHGQCFFLVQLYRSYGFVVEFV